MSTSNKLEIQGFGQKNEEIVADVIKEMEEDSYKNVIYVVNDEEGGLLEGQMANWLSRGFEVHFSGRKTLAGKRIKHMYIYSHGGLNKPLCRKKAALANTEGDKRCTGKALADLLRNDGFLMTKGIDGKLFSIPKDRRPLITVMACGAGISPGNKQVKVYLQVYTKAKNLKRKEKLRCWEKHYQKKYKDWHLPVTNKPKPFVNDFWREMKKLGLKYEENIKRVHAFKAVVKPCRKGDVIFKLMTYGLKKEGKEAEFIGLDLNSETITQQQMDEAENGDLLVILPKPQPSSNAQAQKQSFHLPNYSVSDMTRYRRMMNENQSCHLQNYPTFNTGRGRRTINENKKSLRQNFPTSNTARGRRMIVEVGDKIRNEELNLGYTRDIDEEFWC